VQQNPSQALRIRTWQIYVDWIKRFIRYLSKADH